MFRRGGEKRAVCRYDSKKIEMLKKGKVPFYEPGLDAIVVNNQNGGRLSFSTELQDAEDLSLVFIAVGTRQAKTAQPIWQYVLEAARGDRDNSHWLQRDCGQVYRPRWHGGQGQAGH